MSAQFGLIGFSHKEEGNAEQDMKEIIRKYSLLSEGNAEQKEIIRRKCRARHERNY